jgi:hypothetical protein
MKTFSWLVVLLIGCSTSSNSSADPKGKFKIDGDTYKVFERSFYRSCVGTSTDQPTKVFCACGAVASAGNLLQVVVSNHLEYEEEMGPYMATISMSASQIATCRTKSTQ